MIISFLLFRFKAITLRKMIRLVKVIKMVWNYKITIIFCCFLAVETSGTARSLSSSDLKTSDLADGDSKGIAQKGLFDSQYTVMKFMQFIPGFHIVNLQSVIYKVLFQQSSPTEDEYSAHIENKWLDPERSEYWLEIKHHSFSTYAKCSEKLRFLTP